MKIQVITPIYADDGCHPSAVGSEIAADVISEIIRNNYRQLAANDGDEFCPRCDANLTLQKGYRNDLPYWVCKGVWRDADKSACGNRQ